jgi:hypothetical protein
MSTNIITIRNYANGKVGVTINGHALPDITLAHFDKEHDMVMLNVKVAQCNVLEGDEFLPVISQPQPVRSHTSWYKRLGRWIARRTL